MTIRQSFCFQSLCFRIRVIGGIHGGEGCCFHALFKALLADKKCGTWWISAWSSRARLIKVNILFWPCSSPHWITKSTSARSLTCQTVYFISYDWNINIQGNEEAEFQYAHLAQRVRCRLNLFDEKQWCSCHMLPNGLRRIGKIPLNKSFSFLSQLCHLLEKGRHRTIIES